MSCQPVQPGLVCLFQDAVIEGDFRAAGVGALDERFLVGGAENPLPAHEEGRDFGAVGFQFPADGLRTPDEDAGVPVEFAAADEHLGEFFAGFFREGLDFQRFVGR